MTSVGRKARSSITIEGLALQPGSVEEPFDLPRDWNASAFDTSVRVLVRRVGHLAAVWSRNTKKRPRLPSGKQERFS